MRTDRASWKPHGICFASSGNIISVCLFKMDRYPTEKVVAKPDRLVQGRQSLEDQIFSKPSFIGIGRALLTKLSSVQNLLETFGSAIRTHLYVIPFNSNSTLPNLEVNASQHHIHKSQKVLSLDFFAIECNSRPVNLGSISTHTSLCYVCVSLHSWLFILICIYFRFF